MKALYLLRHGQSEANRLDLVNGKIDDPLTACGREQARGVGQLIIESGIRFDVCFVSQWRRARETAELALPEESFTVDTRLGETDPGNAAGLTFSELPERHPEFNLPFDPLRPYPGGESHQQLYDRSIAWFEEVSSSVPRDATALAVSHGGPICSILQYICKVDMYHFPMFVSLNASFSKITRSDSLRWTLCYFSLPCAQSFENL